MINTNPNKQTVFNMLSFREAKKGGFPFKSNSASTMESTKPRSPEIRECYVKSIILFSTGSFPMPTRPTMIGSTSMNPKSSINDQFHQNELKVINSLSDSTNIPLSHFPQGHMAF